MQKEEKKYLTKQEFINNFFFNNIEQTKNKNDKIKKNELMNHLRECFKEEYEKGEIELKNKPKAQEMYDAFTNKYGMMGKMGWLGVKILYPESDNIDVDIDNTE